MASLHSELLIQIFDMSFDVSLNNQLTKTIVKIKDKTTKSVL